MIKINLAKRKKVSPGQASGFDIKNLKMSDLTTTISNVFGGGGAGGEGKKFDLNSPIPKLIVCAILIWVLDDTIAGWKQEELKKYDGQISAVEKEKKQIQDRMAKIKGYEPVKKQLEEDEKAIRNKLDVVAKLLENRNAPSKIMTQVAQSIPEEVWLTKLDVDEKIVKLGGATPSYSQISDFIKALNSTSQFGDIGFSNIQEAINEKKDQKVHTFELTAKRRLTD